MAREQENGKKGKNLDEYGIVFLSGDITESSAMSVCEKIILYNIAAEVEQIQLIINSNGGELAAGFSIVDIMEWSNIPIYTTGIGRIASMGLLLFMAGAKGHRVLTPRTSILSHRYSAWQFGSHSELLARRKEEDLSYNRILEHYLAYTKVADRAALEQTLLRDVDTWLTPEEAVELGVGDHIERTVRVRGAA